jgi:hypothetical protein
VAKPDCDDGWIKKSIELEAALDFADFTKIARTILRYAFLQLFGWGARPRHARLNCAEIAERIGKPYTLVHRARRELVASGVLVQVGSDPDLFRFVKDYEKWVKVARLKASFYPVPEPRLTPREIADCKDAPAYSRTFDRTKHTEPSTINFDPPKVNLDPPAKVNRDPESGSIEILNPGQSRSTFQVNIDPLSSPPYVPPSRKKEQEQEQEILSSSSSVGDCSGTTTTTTGGRPEVDLSPMGKRLHEWVQSLLREHEYGEGFDLPAAKVIRNWLRSEGDPEWCAQAFQAAMERRIEEPPRYADRVLREMLAKHRGGEMVIPPAICDFRADPSAPPMASHAVAPEAPDVPTTPAVVRLTKPQRDVAQAVRYAESLKKRFASMEASDGQG